MGDSPSPRTAQKGTQRGEVVSASIVKSQQRENQVANNTLHLLSRTG
jgi:hypothetical protein